MEYLTMSENAEYLKYLPYLGMIIMYVAVMQTAIYFDHRKDKK